MPPVLPSSATHFCPAVPTHGGRGHPLQSSPSSIGNCGHPLHPRRIFGHFPADTSKTCVASSPVFDNTSSSLVQSIRCTLSLCLTLHQSSFLSQVNYLFVIEFVLDPASIQFSVTGTNFSPHPIAAPLYIVFYYYYLYYYSCAGL